MQARSEFPVVPFAGVVARNSICQELNRRILLKFGNVMWLYVQIIGQKDALTIFKQTQVLVENTNFHPKSFRFSAKTRIWFKIVSSSFCPIIHA